MHCFIYSHFFSSIWWKQDIWSVADLLNWKIHWWSPVFSFAYGVNLNSRMLEKNVVRIWRKWHSYLLTTIFLLPFLLIGTMIDSFYSSSNSSLFQIELICTRISDKFTILPALNRSSGIWSVPGDLCLFSYSRAISTSKALSSGASGSAVCISLCLTSLTPYAMKSWEN